MTPEAPRAPFQEVFERPSIQQSRHEQEMQNLRRLQWEFNTRLGLPDNPHDMLNRSFNPVTDRWHVETLRRRGDQEGLIGFRDEMRENHRTDLMERYHAAESYGEFLIKDGDLYSPEFPEMPFGEVLNRGAEYRKGLGSPEQEREGKLGEGGGWSVIASELSRPDTRLGTTFISLSPPSLVKNGAYKGKFVDKYTLEENSDKKRMIKRARIAVDWGDNEYKKAALAINPNFFDEYDGRPMDAWFLSHPLKANKEVTPITSSGLSKEDFNYVYNDAITQKLIAHYESLIFARNVDWVEVTLAVNSIRNHADDLKNGLREGIRVVSYEDTLDEVKFLAYVYKRGMQKVESVGGGGCPENKGFDLGGILGHAKIELGHEIFSNSVAKFLKGEQEWFNCPKCNYQADGPVGNTCPGCQLTFEKYKEEMEAEGAEVCA